MLRVICGLLVGVLCLVSDLKASSAPHFNWSQSLGGSGSERADRVVTDREGNCYITGYVGSTNAMFGTNSAENSSTGSKVFVAKFNRSGSNLWVQTAGGAGDDEGRALAVDEVGNVYVTGAVKVRSGGGDPVSVEFGSTNLVLQGFNDFFLAKYDANGNFLWVRQAWSTGFPIAEGTAISVRGTNVYAVGHCRGGMNFGGVLLADAQLFLAQYDDAGNLLSARNVGYDTGPNDNLWAYDVAVDGNGDCYIASDFGSEQFTIGGTTLTRTGSYSDGLLTKWDASGNLLWFKQVTEGRFGACVGVRLNADGNVTVLGRTLFASGAFAGEPVGDGFLASLSRTGGVLWVKTISTNAEINGLASDLAGNSFVSGTVSPVGTTLGGQSITNNSSSWLPFIAKFDTSGTFAWVKLAASTSTNSGYNTAWSMDADPSGAIYVAGQGQSDLRFDSSTTTNHGAWDVLLARLDPEPPFLSLNRTGTNLLLSWPTNQIGFQLERSSLMASGWTQGTNPAVRLGREFVSTNATPSTAEFFRLKLEP